MPFKEKEFLYELKELFYRYSVKIEHYEGDPLQCDRCGEKIGDVNKYFVLTDGERINIEIGSLIKETKDVL